MKTHNNKKAYKRRYYKPFFYVGCVGVIIVLVFTLYVIFKLIAKFVLW